MFDLDETLIHCNENPDNKSDVKLNIILQTGDCFEAGINIRPYALTLLENLYKKYELILFTASHSSYANVVLDYLDPDKKLFQHRLFREHCYHTEVGMYVKDLRIINRRPEDMVLIDNAAYSYAFQLDNGIPILSYYEGQDFELKALEKYIERLHDVPDIRMVNRQTFKLHHYTKFDNPEDLIEQLYMN